MKQLAPVAGRTVKQLLRRLYQHYTGDPLGNGLPLRAVAEGMLVSPRDSLITFLSSGSFIVDHVILTDPDGLRLADANTYVRVRWIPPVYNAMILGGNTVKLNVLEQMSIEDFIDQSGLRHTFARRTDQPFQLPPKSDGEG